MMIEYIEGGNVAVINGYRFRRDGKTGYFLSSRLIGGRRKRLHVYVWELYNGAIPAGYEVHHKDHNKRHNEIENLEILTEAEHKQRHREETTEEQRQVRRDNLTYKARPKASEWHGSEAGKAWHREHYEAMKDRLHVVTEYFCTECGGNFLSTRMYSETENRFCCNNCKSAFRRRSGVDNVERKCEFCGEIFITNKYSKAKYCEKHRRKGSRGRGQS